MAGKTSSWMPIYIADYLRDTSTLSASEHGAYLLLIMEAWTQGGPLPLDSERRRRVSRMDPKDWRRSEAVVMAFFYIEGDVYRHKRIEEELEIARASVEQKSAAGKASARERARQRIANGKANGNPTGVATAGPTEGQRQATPTPTPTQTSNEVKESKADALAAKALENTADEPPDPNNILWTHGKRWLVSQGMTETKAGSILGKWRKDHEAIAIIEAMRAAKAESPSDLIAFINGALRTPRRPATHVRQAQQSARRNDGTQSFIDICGDLYAEARRLEDADPAEDDR